MINEEFLAPLSQFDRDSLSKLDEKDQLSSLDEYVHTYGNNVVCATDKRSFPTPRNKSPLELVVDAPEGAVRLWAKGTVLKWRFQDTSLAVYNNRNAFKKYLRNLLGLGLNLWGESVPVKFKEVQENYDFELIVAQTENCSAKGCVLASAFFPDAGRNKLTLFSTLFDQSYQEQIETMAHELGHIFGLRHFFADVSEEKWPSLIFGNHSKFSIMNYGNDSYMTANDRADLAALYKGFWDGSLTEINGTPLIPVSPCNASISTT